MADISKIDKNFKVETKINKEGLLFRNADEACFKLHGVYRDGEKYRRLPESVAKASNSGVHGLHANTAGGRIRFVTNSAYVAISAKMSGVGKMSHFPLTGSVGFDLYEKKDGRQIYLKSFIPPFDVTDGYESLVELGEARVRELTINFPLYSNVDQLFIGLDEKASVSPAPDYTYPVPVVYYGSSITQGGCASRPGNAYQAMVSNWLDCDHINLGFSGSARGEDAIVDYMSTLDMSVFVCDYDYNAPNSEHLRATHEPLYKKIRAANPDLPIVFMTVPSSRLVPDRKICFDIIKATYENAVAAGDKNVYFIPGYELISDCDEDIATVDTCHPNDYGFYCMAKRVAEELKKILK